MVFDNILGFAQNSAGLFSVKADEGDAQPGADVDFEDAEEDTYDDKSKSLFIHAIHGATSRSKVVQEQSPEARVILGILGSFIQTTRDSAGTQAKHAHASSVSDTASAGMTKASERVKKEDGLQKNEDLQAEPDKEAYAKAPQASGAPKAAQPPKSPQATAETPQKLGKTEPTTEGPSGSQ